MEEKTWALKLNHIEQDLQSKFTFLDHVCKMASTERPTTATVTTETLTTAAVTDSNLVTHLTE